MKVSIKETAVFGMLGAILYGQKVLFAALPNIHLSAVLVIVYTAVYRMKALYPICIYIILEGIFGGFTLYWVPYIYVWLILWGVVMLLPRDLPERRFGFIVYMVTGGLHGLLYGTLFTPIIALGMGFDFNGAIAWIISGLPYDAIHAASNFVLCGLCVPLIRLMRKLKATYQ